MKKILLFLFCAGFASALTAQEIHVTQRQTDKTVKLAHPFAVQYKLSYTPDSATPTLDENTLPDDFEVTQAVFTPHASGTGTYDLTVVPFTLGKSTFTATFLLTQDDKTIAQTTDSYPLSIAPANMFRDKKLREIRPPHIPFGWWFWIFVLLAVASCVYAWTTWRRHKAQAGLSLRATRDDRPCDKIALSQLDSLLASGLWERQAYKLFYITLSDILREYLWHRFQTDVSADTSAELVRRVKSIPLLEPQITPLRDFLNSGDLVKFAKVQPSENTRNKDVQFLRGLIQATAPQEAASKPEENK